MKDWTGNKKSTFIGLQASNHSEKDREKDDYYATNPSALKIFLKKLKEDGIELDKNIHENACGGGHLSEVLKSEGYEVFSTDLIDRGYKGMNSTFDVLKQKIEWSGDILTNPPYKYAEDFLKRSMDSISDGNKVIMFLKIQFLEGKKRKELFKKYPPKYVYVNSARQLCAMNGEFEKYTATALCYCWFVWEKGFSGDPVIKWI